MKFNKKIFQNIEKEIKKYPMCQIMAVTKNRPKEIIEEIIIENHLLFGENKVQEAEFKFSDLRKKYKNIELHLIGPLQTNKVKTALKVFDVIQTLDREKLVNEIVKKLDNLSLTKRFFIQINIGGEQQKSGIPISSVKDFYYYCKENGLTIQGLMCIPPNDKDVEFFFKKMNQIKNDINQDFLLSMGMSNDYNQALKHHSNIVRIGSALFNE